jgi:hypothetical protein
MELGNVPVGLSACYACMIEDTRSGLPKPQWPLPFHKRAAGNAEGSLPTAMAQLA